MPEQSENERLAAERAAMLQSIANNLGVNQIQFVDEQTGETRTIGLPQPHPVPPTNGAEVELPPEAAVADDHQNPRRGRNRRREESEGAGYGEVPEVGVLVEPDESDDLDALVLHDNCRTEVIGGLRAIEIREQLEREWNLSRICPQKGRCILNFHGGPGTGKTRVARAIAKRLGKKMYQVDYSAVISKYLGDTAKHIVYAFKRAKELDAILFFDEADSLLSKRVSMDESCATSINQNRNTLMQELDRFDGVVIVTTNLFKNYDDAVLRRIQRHIFFDKPNLAMRVKLFQFHLPNPQRVRADLRLIAEESKGLTGGDILNVCVNAIYAASASDDPAQWIITNAVLMAEIEKVREAKRDHRPESPSRN